MNRPDMSSLSKKQWIIIVAVIVAIIAAAVTIFLLNRGDDDAEVIDPLAEAVATADVEEAVEALSTAVTEANGPDGIGQAITVGKAPTGGDVRVTINEQDLTVNIPVGVEYQVVPADGGNFVVIAWTDGGDYSSPDDALVYDSVNDETRDGEAIIK